MADDYSNIFKNVKSARRCDFGNVYNPHTEVNIWRLIRIALLTTLIVGFVIGAVFAYMADADAHTDNTPPLHLKLSTHIS